MKLFKLFTLLMMISVFTACGDDEEDCVQADWVGTYSGTITCTESSGTLEDSGDVTVNITASGSNNIIITYDSDLTEIETEPLAFSGCTLSETVSDGGFSLTITADLAGDELTLTDVFSADTESSTCVINATRN